MGIGQAGREKHSIHCVSSHDAHTEQNVTRDKEITTHRILQRKEYTKLMGYGFKLDDIMRFHCYII